MTTLSTRQTFALVALFVVTSLTFIQLDSRSALDPIKNGLAAVVSPAAEAFGRLGRGSDGDSPLEQEVARLKAENSELLAENARLQADTREVEQLREQAGLREEHPDWQPLQARVRNPDPANKQKILVIDKGSADGVEVGMPVVAQGRNYIGQVTKVEERAARVTLAIDVTHQVGARLESGADGIVYGMWQKGGRLELRYLDRGVKAKPNELVLTTASDAVRTARVPGDLIIGRVGDKVERNLQGDEQTVLVVPLVDFDELQVVTVLLGNAA